VRFFASRVVLTSVLLSTMVFVAPGIGKVSRSRPKSISKSTRGKPQKPVANLPPVPSSTVPSAPSLATEPLPNSLPAQPSSPRKIRDVVAEGTAASDAKSPQKAIDPLLLELAKDDTAYLDAAGPVYFDTTIGSGDFALLTNSAESVLQASASKTSLIGYTADPLHLSSRPTATKTIYLDFDGETISNTSWNRDYWGGQNRTVAGYNTDGNPSGFSSSEAYFLWNVWSGVAEDFSPFDVNVTTEKPTAEALEKSSPQDTAYGTVIVFTPDNIICPATCGGVAHFGSFGNRYEGPAWVFTSSTDSRYWVDAASHEAGHALGLMHHGTTTTEYYLGHANWGPIMGFPSYASFNRMVSQWSHGEYLNANRPYQDDFAVIAGTLGAIPDDGSSQTNPSVTNIEPLLPDGMTITDERVLARPGDVDLYSVNVSGGYLNVSMSMPQLSNMHPYFNVRDSAGRLVMVGLQGMVELIAYQSVPNGQYFIEVGSTGYLDPATNGYSAYGSIGTYRLRFTQVDKPSNTLQLSVVQSDDKQLTATWTPAVVTNPFSKITYEYSLCSASYLCGSPTTTSATSAVVNFATCGTGHIFKLVVRDQFGFYGGGPISSLTSTYCKPIAPTPNKLRYDAANHWATLNFAAGQEFAPLVVVSYTVTLVNKSTNEVSTKVIPPYLLEFTTTLPVDWKNTTVEVTITSNTAAAAPWNASLPSATGSFVIGRLDAPQADPPSSSTPRGDAPQAPGVTVPRGAAPQA
jgi:hypothetical protein